MLSTIYSKAKIIGKEVKVYHDNYCSVVYFDIVKCWVVGNELCFLVMNKILGRTEFLHLKIENKLLNNIKCKKELRIMYYLGIGIQRLIVCIECIDSETYIAYNILGFKSGRLISVDCDYTNIKEYYTKEFGWVVYAIDGIINTDNILITENKTYIESVFDKNGKRILLRTNKNKIFDSIKVYVKEVDKCNGLVEAEVVE